MATPNGPFYLTKRQRSALKEAQAQHSMSYENGKCLCGEDLKGNFSAAEAHFYTAVFLAGIDFAKGVR